MLFRKILQGCAQRIQRIVDLMTQSPRHVFQEPVVLLQLFQHVGNAACQIPNLVPGIDLIQQAASTQATAHINRCGCVSTQIANAPG